MALNGSQIIARVLKRMGVDDFSISWVKRVYDPARIPELVNKAFQLSMSGKPGPVYLDFPGDVLYREVEEESIAWPVP